LVEGFRIAGGPSSIVDALNSVVGEIEELVEAG
jgi:hypothetical protein